MLRINWNFCLVSKYGGIYRWSVGRKPRRSVNQVSCKLAILMLNHTFYRCNNVLYVRGIEEDEDSEMKE